MAVSIASVELPTPPALGTNDTTSGCFVVRVSLAATRFRMPRISCGDALSATQSAFPD